MSLQNGIYGCGRVTRVSQLSGSDLLAIFVQQNGGDMGLSLTLFGTWLSENVVAADLVTFLATANTWSAAQRGAYVALASQSNSIAVNLARSNNFSHTLTQNTTLAAPSNVVAGQSGVIEFTQADAAPFTLAYNAFWKWAAGTPISISATLGAKSVMTYLTDSTGAFATCTMQVGVS